MQTQADLLQVPVEVFASPDATALGVGAAARLGLDPELAVPAALGSSSPGAVYEPAISATEAAERQGQFRSAVSLSLGGADR